MDEEADAWFDRELAGCSLADERLNKRLRKLVAQIGCAMGESIPLVCQDWANTKAAYRVFSNDGVSEADILAGHFQSTRERTIGTDGPVLVLHDTTEFSYQRELGRDRDHQKHKQRPGQGGRPEIAHGLRHPDALEPGGDDRRAAAWTDGGQILDPEEIQGDRRA
ncbi:MULTISPECIES: transposase DNA-binding-containing protein [unclassified Bradyrhizobium]|uniref:IS4/Tn5 family transposase DNA-binding protein n=1 Tax=unclassified Bradyrhizobium TaxID=2631580 RepID=UPI001CD7F76F|nr:MULTISPECIES: transposase DNA-binding-containing protein [unclassified Bradyrhizobium]